MLFKSLIQITNVICLLVTQVGAELDNLIQLSITVTAVTVQEDSVKLQPPKYIRYQEDTSQYVTILENLAQVLLSVVQSIKYDAPAHTFIRGTFQLRNRSTAACAVVKSEVEANVNILVIQGVIVPKSTTPLVPQLHQFIHIQVIVPVQVVYQHQLES